MAKFKLSETISDLIINHEKLGYKLDDNFRFISPMGIELKISKGTRGYAQTKIKRKTIMFHRIIAFKKFGMDLFNKNLICRHIDGNKMNWHPDNLMLGTHKDNYYDMPISYRDESITKKNLNNRKHSDTDIIRIRELLQLNKTHSEIAKLFNCSSGSIYQIATGKSYKDSSTILKEKILSTKI